MTIEEIQRVKQTSGERSLHSILKRNGITNNNLLKDDENLIPPVMNEDGRPRSYSDPKKLIRKVGTDFHATRQGSLTIKEVPSKSDVEHRRRPRFGDTVEIQSNSEEITEIIYPEVSDYQKEDESHKPDTFSSDPSSATKEMTILEVLQQFKRIVSQNRNEISMNLLLILLILLLLIPSILFAKFNEPDDPYQYDMTSYATVWPLKHEFALYHGAKNNGPSLKVDWGKTIPYLAGVPNMCQNKKPWCYSWSNNSFLLLTPIQPIPGIDCVRFDWQNLTKQLVEFSDCFSAGNETSYWYGGPVGVNTRWPSNDLASSQYATILTGDVQTSFQDLYGVQEPFWVSNDGFAVLISKHYSVSINQNKSELCIISDPYVGRLQYAVCRGENPTTLVLERETMQKVFDVNIISTVEEADGVQHESNSATLKNETMFNVLVTIDARDLDNTNITEVIEILSPFNLSFIVMFQYFDFFDTQMSSDLLKMLNETKLSNFYPVAIESSNYIKVSYVDFDIMFWETLCVAQRAAGPQSLTALNPIGTVIWRKLLYFVVDFTLTEVQNKFMHTIGIHPIANFVQYLAFTGGTATELPVQAQLNVTNDNWNCYSTMYAESVSTLPNTISISTGYDTQHLNNLHIDIPVTLSSVYSIIPIFLTLNMQGYSYLILHLFDPDETTLYLDVGEWNSTKNLTQWLQIAMHLPLFRTPYQIIDTDNYKTAYDKYSSIRHNTILPHYLNATINHTLYGHPIIRPMWWFGDQDHDAWICDNQYMIGDNLLVAAFLTKHNFQVYLPTGTWQDPTMPTVCHKGGGVVAINYPADIMCFERVIDSDICLHE